MIFVSAVILEGTYFNGVLTTKDFTIKAIDVSFQERTEGYFVGNLVIDSLGLPVFKFLSYYDKDCGFILGDTIIISIDKIEDKKYILINDTRFPIDFGSFKPDVGMYKCTLIFQGTQWVLKPLNKLS